MPDTLPEETNRYNRVDSTNLLADTNLAKQGSITTEVDNPKDWSLWSRTGGDLDTARSPLPGYCLHFAQANQYAYIQTSIPSSERDNYDVIIKGEGNTEILVVDASKDNIAIKQGFSLASSPSAYFDLSYIAFINRSTGKLDHLFECEEGLSTSTNLYDAVTGDIATIENASSLSDLRVSKQTKEFIKDLDYVKDEIRLSGNTLYSRLYKSKCAVNTAIPKLKRSELTLACMFKKDEKVSEQFLLSIGNSTANNATTNTGFAISAISSGNIRIRANMIDNSGATATFYFDIPLANVPASNIYDGKWHSVVVVFNNTLEKGFKCFYDSTTEIPSNVISLRDSVTNAAVTLDFTNAYMDPTQINIGKNPNGAASAESGSWNGYVKNPKIFNFDITKEGSLYTVEDYLNDKDVPNVLLSTEVATKAISGTPPTATNGSWSRSGDVFTFDGYSYNQYEVARISTLHLAPGSWVTYKIKVDGYTTEVSGDTSKVGLYWGSLGGTGIRTNSTSDASANLNRAMYACADKYQYTIYEDDGTTVVDSSSEITLSNTTANPPLFNALLRPVDDYETSRPRILVIRLHVAENLIKDTFGRFPYMHIATTINTAGNLYRFTGTIEYLGSSNDTCIFDGGNLSQSTMLWMDKSFNANNLTFSLSNTKLNSDSKCYGTFANAYGYTNNAGEIIPRKLN